MGIVDQAKHLFPASRFTGVVYSRKYNKLIFVYRDKNGHSTFYYQKIKDNKFVEGSSFVIYLPDDTSQQTRNKWMTEVMAIDEYIRDRNSVVALNTKPDDTEWPFVYRHIPSKI